MHYSIRLLLGTALLLALAQGSLRGTESGWSSATPEQVGLDRTRLDGLRDRLAARRTSALLILRQDRIAYEWYAPGAGSERPHYTASLAKALVGGISLLVALDDERIGVDDPASKYIPGWGQDAQRQRISIRHLATHTSGIEDAEEDGKPHADLAGWKGAFWRRDPDPFTIALGEAPVIFAPGTRYGYSNPGMAALAYAVTASLRGAPQPDIRTLLRERIMIPLGLPDAAWSIGYGRAYDLDGLKLYANWGGGSFTARAIARAGQLMLQRGEWNGRQLVRRATVERMISYADMPLPERSAQNPAPGSGLGWWLNFDGVWPAVPRDAFAGAGAGHQVLLVVPSLDLIAVRQGEALAERAAGFWGPVVEHFFQPLVEAVTWRSPYPPSRVIRRVTFEPEAGVVCKALDSDNWPITWGDDDAQYAAYGDGYGFEPRTEAKLSLGFARITGPPDRFEAYNVRSESGERVGDGKAGLKASGMLMVDGVLYMWVRNAGNAQLAWSEDRARTWAWGFKFETSFGSPAFLNFGKNYRGARDDYVYAYSQDGASAYESDDRIILARVRKKRIRERAAYEFFERLDEQGHPVWTADSGRRGAVFRNTGRCQRVEAVYNPGIRRYLLAVGYNHRGGWGIFDAPEPWGPWTTAFHTEYWGLGGTHGYRLPAKWISSDGLTMELVFSGTRHAGPLYDAFCTRRFRLELAPR